MKSIYIERAALLVILLVTPLCASADPFDQTGYQVKTWLVTTLGPFAAVAVVGLGLAALAGMLSGMMAFRILLAIGLIFGADQIVAMFRAWVGV